MDESTRNFIIQFAMGLPGLLVGIVFHEYSHGRMALHFGDPTAKASGRLTFNIASHLELWGSVIVPILSILLGGSMFGWAKPVPINPANFKNYRKGLFWVSFAGPLANYIIVILSALGFALCYHYLPSSFYLQEPILSIFRQSVLINTIIGTFNLIPLPPLDGSRIVSSMLSFRGQQIYDQIGRYSIIFFLLLIFTPIGQYIFLPPLVMANSILAFFLYLF